MFLIGKVRKEAQLLVERTYEAMMRAIKNLGPGKYLNDCGGGLRISSPFGYARCVNFVAAEGIEFTNRLRFFL